MKKMENLEYFLCRLRYLNKLLNMSLKWQEIVMRSLSIYFIRFKIPKKNQNFLRDNFTKIINRELDYLKWLSSIYFPVKINK